MQMTEVPQFLKLLREEAEEEVEVEAVEEVQDLHLAGQFLWVVCFKVESLNFAQWGTETIQIPHLVKLH